MSLRKVKKPLFIDLDNGRIGVLVDKVDIVNEKGICDLTIKPLLGMGWGWKNYQIKGVKNDACKLVIPPDTNITGVSDTIFFLTEGTDGKSKVLDVIGKSLDVNLRNINKQLDELRFENESLKRKLKEYESSIDKQKSKLMNRRFGQPGMMGGRFGDFRDRDFEDGGNYDVFKYGNI